MNEKDIVVKRMEKDHIDEVKEIASSSFSGMKEGAKEWISCNFSAFPRMQYFVAVSGEDVLGYILWMEKGGFRRKSVWELEQIAVRDDMRGQGIGSLLIKNSLSEIKKYLKERGSELKLIEVTTGKSNKAQKIYRKTLGAKSEAVIKDLFRDDEVIMIARE